MSLFLIAGLCLTGCSNKYNPDEIVTMEWQPGSIMYNGKPTDLTEYRGNTATVENGNGNLTYNFSISAECTSVVNIDENVQGIEEADMDKLGDKWYYLEYLGSVLTLAKDLGSGYFQVCQVGHAEQYEPALVAKYASDYIDQFVLTKNVYRVDFGSFYFGSEWDDIKMTKEAVSIKGTAKVTQGSKGCTTPFSLTSENGKTTLNMMMMSEGKYDWYEVDGYLIQIASGLNITDYIHVK